MSNRRVTLNLKDIVDEESINCIEVYIAMQKDDRKIEVGKRTPFQLYFMQNANLSNIREYHHKDLTYIFDLADDGQKAIRRILIKDTYIGNIYALSYKEDVLPSHRFPCTDDISHKNEIERKIYRVNNRMFVYYDKVKEKDDTIYYYVYIRYNHAQNVDLKKMQIDMDNTIQRLEKEVISLLNQ